MVVSYWYNGLNDGLRNRSTRVRTPVAFTFGQIPLGKV